MHKSYNPRNRIMHLVYFHQRCLSIERSKTKYQTLDYSDTYFVKCYMHICCMSDEVLCSNRFLSCARLEHNDELSLNKIENHLVSRLTLNRGWHLLGFHSILEKHFVELNSNRWKTLYEECPNIPRFDMALRYIQTKLILS